MDKQSERCIDVIREIGFSNWLSILPVKNTIIYWIYNSSETACAWGTASQFQVYQQYIHAVKSLIYSMRYPTKKVSLSPLDTMN